MKNISINLLIINYLYHFIAEFLIHFKTDFKSPKKQQELISKGTKQLVQFGSAEKRAIRVLELCKQIMR